MKHLDLFSGIGNFILAAKQAGLETVAGCEIEKHWQTFLEDTYDIPIVPDIRQFGIGREYDTTPYKGVEVITGGPPCQPASLAGRRKGKDDHRWLWPEAIRIVSEIRPTWFVFENPVGIKTMGLDGILSELESLSYETVTLDLPACAVNAPHRRKRLWIVGRATDTNGGRLSERMVQGQEIDIEPMGKGKASGLANANDDAGTPTNSDGESVRDTDTVGHGSAEGDGKDDAGSTYNTNNAGLERFSGDGDGIGKEEPHRSTATAGQPYDDYELRLRWTGKEYVVSRVLRGFSGVAHGQSKRVLEGYGNAVVVPLAAELLKAIVSTARKVTDEEKT